jgi:hypothetical protein
VPCNAATFQTDRLSEFIAGLRREVTGVPDVAEREKLLIKIKQAEAASEIEAWVNSRELQPPND